MLKLKAKVVRNRLNKYNVFISYQGKEMPVSENGKILEWSNKEGAQEYIFVNKDRLERVD